MKAAEQAGFEILLTTDKNMVSQQNLMARAIAIVVLGNSQWRTVQRFVRRIAATVDGATPGSYVEVEIPFQWAGGACKKAGIAFGNEAPAASRSAEELFTSEDRRSYKIDELPRLLGAWARGVYFCSPDSRTDFTNSIRLGDIRYQDSFRPRSRVRNAWDPAAFDLA